MSGTSHRTVAGACAAAAAALALATAVAPAHADETTLPLAAETRPASADECAVWRRERSFALSVEAHDAAAFAAHLHPGTVFNAGDAAADRGRDTVVASWAGIVEGQRLVLRWRPGIVQIGGEPGIAVSKGPYILEARRDGKPSWQVGFYQTVWVRDAAAAWRVLYDGPASTPQSMDDRAAAVAWVTAQPMSDCAR